MNRNNQAFEIVGWIGAAAFLFGYLMISTGSMNAQGLAYQSLVLLGAAGIVVVSLYKKTYQTAVLNGIFGLIALAVMLQLWF